MGLSIVLKEFTRTGVAKCGGLVRQIIGKIGERAGFFKSGKISKFWERALIRNYVYVRT